MSGPTRVDPRASGGARRPYAASTVRQGRSPRERGSQAPAPRLLDAGGSIPARAGEPSRPPPRRRHSGVDPRASGGAVSLARRSRRRSGRSPRERGSRGVRVLGRGALGSIPARAGEPGFPQRFRTVPRVDPRASGGANLKRLGHSPSHGRSPRERGSRRAAARHARQDGSIPARAGEPGMSGAHASTCRVDPRASGGAAGVGGGHVSPAGRSPRERGSRDGKGRHASHRGSIPARAGEPIPALGPPNSIWVDPRASGGAYSHWEPPDVAEGRSPRERGSLESGRRNAHLPGSIPRASGGASSSCTRSCARTGRSPRERGSP